MRAQKLEGRIFLRPQAGGKREGRRRTSSSRVLRGGSWNNNDRDNLLSSNRNNNNPTNRNNNIGFRVVLGLDEARKGANAFHVRGMRRGKVLRRQGGTGCAP